jgi:hypothetical protein
MHVVTLRHYASHFCGLPSTGRRNKHDLVLWILQNSSQDVLNSILSFAAARVVQNGGNRRKRARGPADVDDSVRDAFLVRREESEDQPPNTSVFLDLPSDVEIKSCYQSFYESTSNVRLRSGVCGVCGRQAFYDSDQLSWFSLQRIPNRHRLIPSDPHPAHRLLFDLLLEPSATQNTPEGFLVQICRHCIADLKSGDCNLPPRRSLANNLWIGEVPEVLKQMTFPEQLLVSLVYPRVFDGDVIFNGMGRQPPISQLLCNLLGFFHLRFVIVLSRVTFHV